MSNWTRYFRIDSTTKAGKIKKITIITIASLILITGLTLSLKAIFEYFDGINEAEKLKSLYEQGNESKTSDSLTGDGSVATSSSTASDNSKNLKEEDVTTGPILSKYSELLKLNKEVIGWIKLDDTRIDYPILQHDDNEYYLHMSPENKKSSRGSVYIDYRNASTLTDKNTLIYAHNMKDGSMFKRLVSYKTQSFFDTHRTIHIDNLYSEGLWEVFSVYVVDADKETISIDYSKEGSFLKAMNAFKNRSMFKTDTQFDENDRIVTLVTCSYETRNSRTIVHAKYIGKNTQQ